LCGNHALAVRLHYPRRLSIFARILETVCGVTTVIMMDRVPQPVKDPPNLIRNGQFSLDRLLSHSDPGTTEESEDFVKRIYGQRRIDLSSDRNGKTGR
jgi:hypothetical protein